MASTRSSRRSIPFIFSNFNRYYLLAFFGLAIIGSFIDSNAGREILSDNSITISLGYPLAVIYFFWSAIDTFIWIIRRPNELLEFAKTKGSKKRSGLLSRNPSRISFYYFYSIFVFLLGIVELVGTVKMVSTWFK